MFLRCVKGTKTATISEKIISGVVAGPVIHITATGKAMEAAIEPKETNLVGIKKATKTNRHITTAPGNKMVIIPARVAIPLPPLKPAKTGKTCPSSAKRPKVS